MDWRCPSRKWIHVGKRRVIRLHELGTARAIQERRPHRILRLPSIYGPSLERCACELARERLHHRVPYVWSVIRESRPPPSFGGGRLSVRRGCCASTSIAARKKGRMGISLKIRERESIPGPLGAARKHNGHLYVFTSLATLSNIDPEGAAFVPGPSGHAGCRVGPGSRAMLVEQQEAAGGTLVLLVPDRLEHGA